VKDNAFAEAAEGALELVPTTPRELGPGHHIVPRDFLRALAATASDWPHTPREIWYGDIMQACFLALAHGRPIPEAGEDERSAAEGITFGVLLAMISMDRGGHHAAAELCQTALDYMATLPAWHNVGIETSASGASLTIDLTAHQPTKSNQPGHTEPNDR
jgi:hypothetical protein